MSHEFFSFRQAYCQQAISQHLPSLKTDCACHIPLAVRTLHCENVAKMYANTDLNQVSSGSSDTYLSLFFVQLHPWPVVAFFLQQMLSVDLSMRPSLNITLAPFLLSDMCGVLARCVETAYIMFSFKIHYHVPSLSSLVEIWRFHIPQVNTNFLKQLLKLHQKPVLWTHSHRGGKTVSILSDGLEL